MDPHFAARLKRWLGDGLTGVALVDRNGKVIAIAGTLTEEEAMPLVALVMYRLKSTDLASRLFDGEVVALDLDDRDVAVGVAKRQLFVVAAFAAATPGKIERAQDLRDDVAHMLMDMTESGVAPPWSEGGGKGGTGPAELPVIEFGVTVRRGKA